MTAPGTIVAPRRLRHPARGFSLIEFLAVLAVVVIFSTLAAAPYQTMLAQRRANGVVSALTDSLWTARSEALKRNADVGFTVANSGWTIAQGSTTVRSQEAFSNITLTPTTQAYTFNAYGRLTTGTGTNILVSAGSSVYRCVTVTSTGRVSTTSPTTATCP